jgi:hypothetical protein
MTQPVKNTCTPASTYGGFEHTIFLGCSVMSFSTSLGWNEQISECTVQVVHDPCPAPAEKPKHYWDGGLNHHTTTAADPGFVGEFSSIIGCPAYFRVGDFEFSGIIQSWVKDNSTSGNPVYTVKLVSPQQVIEGVQLIVNEYAGSVGNTPNLFNCFGYMESFGSTCPQTYLAALPPTVDNYEFGDSDPDGAIFGTPAGGYGGALVNENGMQWTRINTAFNILANAVPRAGNIWNGGTLGGRVMFKGTTDEGYGLLSTSHPDGFTEYFVDISELPEVPTFWRLNGVSVGLLDTIKSICEESGYDFYIELCYVQDAFLDGSGIAKFIKVRTVSRVVQPGSFDSIADFATASGSIQASYGRELRNEVTSSFVIGGSRETVYQIEQNLDPEADGQPANEEADDIIIPFFGLNSDGDMIVPERDGDDYWTFEVDTFGINERLKVLALPAIITIHELELLFGLGGYDSWLSFEAEGAAAGAPTDIGTAINAVGLAGMFQGRQLVKILVDNQLPAPRDFIAAIPAAFPGAAGNEGKIAEDIQAIYDWLMVFAREYYGRQFAVRVPYTCAYEDSESGTVIHSELPNQDGWTEHESIIGLGRNTLPMERFKNESYKFESMVRFEDADTLAFNKLDQNDIYADAGVNKLWVKTEVSEAYVYHDASTLAIPRVVLKLDQPVNFIENDAENPEAARLVVELMVRRWGQPRATVEAAIKKVGAQELFGVLPYIPVMPVAASFGLKSNITTYGPWYNPGAAGQVVVQRDEGLVPWEYSDVDTMAMAGQSIADAQVTNMQVGETGSVTVPGYPTVPLGAELGAVGGGFFGAGTNLVENRTASTGSFSGTHVTGGAITINYGFFSYGGNWTGLYGPNVTGITVQVGPDGLTTSYEFRTFTPKFGRFAKYNAERLKQVGKQRLKAQKQLKAIMAQQVRRNIVGRQAAARERRAGRVFDPGTPHECYIGQTYQFNGRTRTLVADESLFNSTVEMKADYGKKAFMSLDGLMRPVSMDGDGGLPRYIIPKKANCQHLSSAGSQSAILKGDGNCGIIGSTEYYAGKRDVEEIDTDYLNPFSNPPGMARSAVVEDKSEGSGYGHDIDIVGRGTGVHESSIIMPIAGYNEESKADYRDDYRPMALRGPLLMQGWGYDIDGRPVPNEADIEADASGGEFTREGLTNRFLDGWLGKSHTWPVAPVDLRLDRDRGVWTAPPAPRSLTARLCENLCISGSAIAEVLNSKTVYDDDGNEIESPMIYVYEAMHNPLLSGDMVLATYDTYECKYYVANNEALGVFPFQLVECMPYNGPGRAKRLKNVNNTYEQVGAAFDLYPGLPDTWGPAPSGYTGWAKWIRNEPSTPPSGDCENPAYATIVTMDRVAEYIVFETTSDFDSVLGVNMAEVNINYYWNGHDPEEGFTGPAYVVLPAHYTKKQCFPAGTKGTAIFDAKMTDTADSGCGPLIYNMIDTNTIPRITHLNCNDSAGNLLNFEAGSLIFSTGLEALQEPGFPCKVRIRSKLRASAGSTCVDFGSASKLGGSDFYFDKLTLGKGLTAITGSECDLTIGAGIFATGVTTCVPKGTLQNKLYNTIQFGKGMSVNHVDACTFQVGAGIAVDSVTTCVTDGTPEDKNYNHINFGAGIYVNHVDDCTVEVGLGLRVNAHQAATITFSDCFDVTETECGVNVDLKTSGDAAQNIEYVYDVECSGDVIVVKTKYLQFTACGLFIGTSGGE